MKAVDTNLLIRVIARDGGSQRLAAQAVLTEQDVLLLPTVILEAEWVLRSIYAMPRAQIAEGLLTVVDQANVTTPFHDAVISALSGYGQAGDFADLLHAALASWAGAESIVTFDRRFAIPGDAPIALEIL